MDPMFFLVLGCCLFLLEIDWLSLGWIEKDSNLTLKLHAKASCHVSQQFFAELEICFRELYLPFEHAFPSKHGDISLLCLFTRGKS